MVEFAIVLMIQRMSRKGHTASNFENDQITSCQCQPLSGDKLTSVNSIKENGFMQRACTTGRLNQYEEVVLFNYKSKWYSKSDVIDFVAFAVFFLAYFLFNLVYMTTYM